MSRGVVPPALPSPAGPNPAKAAFFAEVAAGMEFLSLWHSLSAEHQAELRALLTSAAAAANKPTKGK